MNFAKTLGLEPTLLAQMYRHGGMGAVRQLVKDHMRSVSKVLHPDVLGKSLTYYVKFLEACGDIDAMADEELLSKIRTKASKEETKASVPVAAPHDYFEEFVEVCRGRHVVLPQDGSLRLVSLIANTEVDEDGKIPIMGSRKASFYTVIPEDTGVMFCKDGEDEWQSERGIYFFGSLPRAVDAEIKRGIYPATSQYIHDLQIVGSRPSRGLIPRLTLGKNNGTVKSNYARHIDPSSILLMMAENGQMYHFGYIINNKKID